MKRRVHFGLSAKFILTILTIGTILIVIGLPLAYIKSNSQLRKVIGERFQVLAKGNASKVDREIQRVIAADRLLADKAASDQALRYTLRSTQSAVTDSSLGRFRINWPAVREAEHTQSVLRASWVSSPMVGYINGGINARSGFSAQPMPRISGLLLDGEEQRYLFRVSLPIWDSQTETLVGWLHRDYYVKNLLDSLVYPIQFGKTGYAMIIDNLGRVVSCPHLITGSRIADGSLIRRVTTNEAGWITAKSDDHGRQIFSLVGYAPLAGVNQFLSEGHSWHILVWQDSRETYAPAKKLLIGMSLASLVAVGLLIILGYYASTRIFFRFHGRMQALAPKRWT